ncbi:YdcH family protein [Phenylobacterium sp.]|uniref:YdcH family protein n=1 Tax=Phenylobacterium sp. TaxID=1871053 RepID=UPI003D28BE61
MSRQHLLQLTRKHQDLDAKISLEARSPSSDDLAVRALKRQKLRLKEQIVQAEQAL